MNKHTPQSVNLRGKLTDEQAEAAALALNAGFIIGGVEANLPEFVALVALARRRQPTVCDHGIRWPHPCDQCDVAAPPPGWKP